MWSDNETDSDFLNFSGVADTVAETIVQANGRPISIGVSGAWGVGKSSMIQLIRNALETRDDTKETFVFVNFNAWLYQGYDDARAALLGTVATTLATEASAREKGIDKANKLLRSVNWLRVTQFAAAGLGTVLGLPSGLSSLVIESPESQPDASPPKKIDEIRECFGQTLKELDVQLVVLIDDLDRCLPQTTISTLEAIRLLLFLDNAAFVIAADDTMIKHAVRSHFNGVDDTTVTNYFDKLIQIPIRVPPLGTQEVRAYLMLLFVQNSELPDNEKEIIRKQVCKQLTQTWRGHRVDRAFMQTIYNNFPSDVISKFDTANRLAPLMTSSKGIAGNPRLIKRFLNALSIRMSISNTHGVGVDEAVLAKMLLFERCADPAAYEELTSEVNNSNEGKPTFLSDWEDAALAGKQPDFGEKKHWDTPFIKEWLTVPPRLFNLDLRGVLYVSREHAPLVTPEDRLSSEAAKLSAAILKYPKEARTMQDELSNLPPSEITIIMDRVLASARQIQGWGTPPILTAALTIANISPIEGKRFAAFLCELPTTQIKPAIVPSIRDQSWANDVFNKWENSDTSQRVKNAIKQSRARHGDF